MTAESNFGEKNDSGCRYINMSGYKALQPRTKRPDYTKYDALIQKAEDKKHSRAIFVVPRNESERIKKHYATKGYRVAIFTDLTDTHLTVRLRA